MKHLIAILLPALLTAGCQSAPPLDPDAPHSAYADDRVLVQLKELSIPAEAATVRLQFGHIVARNGVEETEPYCIFELDSVRADPQTVHPDRYRVTAMQRRVQTFTGLPWPDYPLRVRFGNDDGPSHVYFITAFRLHSAAQPQVRALTCQSNQMAPGIAIMRHLTLVEIRAALGDYFRLELPR